MKKAKVYYGLSIDENRPIFASITGQMSDGSYVYTEIAQNVDGSIILENGEPRYILDNQYFRRTRHGMQTFERL